MPNKTGHKRLVQGLFFLATPAALILDPVDFLALETGILLTTFPVLTPDLDVNHRKFGGLGDLLGFRAYAENVPHRFGLRKKHWTRMRLWHVFFFSHLPFIGTALRVMLLLLPLSGLFLLWPVLFELYFVRIVFWLWIGMSLSDLLAHVSPDILTQDFKEERKKRSRSAYRYGGVDRRRKRW